MTTPAARNYSNTATQASLVGNITASDTTFSLTNFSGYPTPPFTATLERGTSAEEVVLVTGVVGSTITATRGYDGTTSKTHGPSSSFNHVVTSIDFAEANAHHRATSGVHGATGALVDVSSSQTLSNKTLTSPTLNAPSVTGGSYTGTQTMATVTVSTKLTVPTPAAGTDAASKAYADALGVSTATASTIARRDAAGRLQVVDPIAGADASTKAYSDAGDAAFRRTGFNGSKTANYSLVLTDEGTAIYLSSGAVAGITVTIPAEATVNFPTGAWVDLFNNNKTYSMTITSTAGVSVWVGGTQVTAGSFTVKPGSYVRLIKYTTNSWVAEGVAGQPLQDTGWVTITSNSPTITASGQVQQYRVLDGVTYLNVYNERGTAPQFSQGFVLFTLPVGARPQFATYLSGLFYGGALAPVKVATNGDVSLDTNSTAVGVIFSGSFPAVIPA